MESVGQRMHIKSTEAAARGESDEDTVQLGRSIAARFMALWKRRRR